MLDAINSRTLSAFPLSVGTSLAFESVFETTKQSIDPDRKIPQKINIEDYTQLWVNVGTLFRNMYNAIDRQYIVGVRAADMADSIQAEMEAILGLVSEVNQGKLKTVFYNCTYDDIPIRFKNGSLRLPRTEKQLEYALLYKNTMGFLNTRSNNGTITEVEQFKSMFTGGRNSVALILTHFPIDLLNAKKFNELDLLESHTGILKKQPDWYTKYYDGRDLNMLPFNGILLTVFGDDQHFRPQNRAMKEALFNLAKERRWTCLTSSAEVVNGIKTLKDHPLRDALLAQEH